MESNEVEKYKIGEKFRLTYIWFLKWLPQVYDVELVDIINPYSEDFTLRLKVEKAAVTYYSQKEWAERLEFKEGMLYVKRNNKPNTKNKEQNNI